MSATPRLIGIEGPVTRKNWRQKLVHDWRDAELVQEDWDFRRCPKDQLKLCVWWEKGREDNQFRLQWKQFLGDKRAGLLGRFGVDTPWLLITVAEREQELRRRTQPQPAGSPAIFVEDWEIVNNPPGYCAKTVFGEARQINGSTSFLYPLSVDWSYTDSALKQCFVAWIREHRPRTPAGEPVFFMRELRGGPRKPEEMLKMIGARRLLMAYGGYKKAEQIARKALGHDLYSDESSWWDAKRKVENQFRPVVFDEDISTLIGGLAAK